MKVAIIDYYDLSSSPYKDPILIPKGLETLGIKIELVTRANYDGELLFGLKVYKIEKWISDKLNNNPPDCVIAISRFDPKLTTALCNIKSRNIPLIIKGDTDGTIGYPILPNYLRIIPFWRSPLNILRQLKWRLPIGYFVSQKIEHIRLADIVIYESPNAGINLTQILHFWRLDEHIDKLLHIPNSISTIYTDSIIEKKKSGTIVAIGRWDDQWCKGVDLLAGVIIDILEKKPDIQFTVIGNNPEYIQNRLPVNLQQQVNFVGQMNYKEMRQLVANIQVILVSSRLESFSLVSGELLCTGATLVAPPIESLIYLSGGGTYGSIARNFSATAISAALLNEIHQWEAGSRNPKDIGNHWRTNLHEKKISHSWLQTINKLLESQPNQNKKE